MAAHGSSSSLGDTPTPEERVRFVAASAERQPGSRVLVSVEVGFDDRSHVAEAEGIGTETIEIRMAAVATLERLRLSQNTLLFFFSDNGANQHGSNGPLRGLKGSVWKYR